MEDKKKTLTRKVVHAGGWTVAKRVAKSIPYVGTAFAIGLVGCYKGYHSQKGTEGVGRSANSAVVLSSVIIFIIDLIVVQVTDILGFN